MNEAQQDIMIPSDNSPENSGPGGAQESARTDPATGRGEQTGLANWHAEAGRKGALRVHELIQAGRLYEKEHGLKSGRQRLRQLIDLGKLYEQEHGLRHGNDKKSSERLSRLRRIDATCGGIARAAQWPCRLKDINLLNSRSSGCETAPRFFQ